MLATRLVKTSMVASIALFSLLVAFDNLVDYDSNYEFVRHTLSMDTTFPGNALRGRAITSPIVWNAAYWVIILVEAAHTKVERARCQLNLYRTIIEVQKRKTSIFTQPNHSRTKLQFSAGTFVCPELVACRHRAIGNGLYPVLFTGGLE